MGNNQKHILLWQKCGENSELAERFYVPGYTGFLPFFLSGENAERFESHESIVLEEKHLLKGILYVLDDIEDNNFKKYPGLWFDEGDKEVLLNLMDELCNGFHFESSEDMILNVAGMIRNENGIYASSKILRAIQFR